MLVENKTNWSNILDKWSATYAFRMSELKFDLSTPEYLQKYEVLSSEKGLELALLDVKQQHPIIGHIDNWLPLYPKLLQNVRNIKR